MLNFKENAVLKTKIKNYESIRRMVDQVLFHPLTLVLFVSVPIYSTFFSPGGLYSELSFPMRALTNAILMSINFIWVYLLLPSVFRHGLIRNIPAIWLLTLIFCVPIFIETMFMSFVVLKGDLSKALEYFFAVMATVLAALFILFNFFKSFAEKSLTHDPLYLAYWAPVRLDCLAMDQNLAHKISGVVTHLKVEQNYTHIYTTEGDYLERGSLSEILQLIDADEGIRIHRSMWIRKDRIGALVYQNGNPKVKAVDGEFFSASRSSISDIKKTIENNLVVN